MINQELENKLIKAIFQFDLRELITKLGIPESQEVELKLYLAKSSEPEATVTIPAANKIGCIACGDISVKDFKSLVKTKFLNKLQLPYNEEIKLVFSTPDLNITFSAGCCCVIEGFCCCYC